MFTPVGIQLFKKVDMGKVDETIAPDRLRVQFKGTFWRAQFLHSSDKQEHLMQALPGELVRVVGRVGLTLLVLKHDANFSPSSLNVYNS
jgi:membrane protein implicated in regulation of membrane protease activity